MRGFWVIIVLFIGACTTSQTPYDFEQAQANEIAMKQKPKFKKPSYISMPNGSATPYSIQDNWHDAVKTTLDILVKENPSYTFCADNREARIGVLKAKLPKCITLAYKESLGVKPVIIGMIDYIEAPITSIYIQVLPVRVEGRPFGFGCIHWTFRYESLDASVWQSKPDFKYPLNDSECIEQPTLYVIPT